MNIDQILTAPINSELSIDDQSYSIGGIEKVRLGSGEHIVWMWSGDDVWFIVDVEGNELMLFEPVEEEVEMDEEGYAMYLGNSYEEEYEDQGMVSETDGATDHEEGDQFEVKQFETERGELLRRLTWTGYGEERWFAGKMIDEANVRLD